MEEALNILATVNNGKAVKRGLSQKTCQSKKKYLGCRVKGRVIGLTAEDIHLYFILHESSFFKSINNHSKEE